jgi:hypothetical protein
MSYPRASLARGRWATHSLGGVVQGIFCRPCQTLIVRIATFASLHGGYSSSKASGADEERGKKDKKKKAGKKERERAVLAPLVDADAPAVDEGEGGLERAAQAQRDVGHDADDEGDGGPPKEKRTKKDATKSRSSTPALAESVRVLLPGLS